MSGLTVLQIVKAHLVAGNFDGLYNADAECGCELFDLAPCGEIGGECRAGYKVPCTDHESEFDFIITEKPEQDLPEGGRA